MPVNEIDKPQPDFLSEPLRIADEISTTGFIFA